MKNLLMFGFIFLLFIVLVRISISRLSISKILAIKDPTNMTSGYDFFISDMSDRQLRNL